MFMVVGATSSEGFLVLVIDLPEFVWQVLCHGRNTDGESHRFTGSSNPEEVLSKVR